MCRIWRQCECRKEHEYCAGGGGGGEVEASAAAADEEDGGEVWGRQAGWRTRQAVERMDNELLHEMIYEYSKGDMQCLLGA